MTGETDSAKFAEQTFATTTYSYKDTENNSSIQKTAPETDIATDRTTTTVIESTSTDSKYIVDWERPIEKDAENPLNWSDRRKWSIIGLLSFLSFLT